MIRAADREDQAGIVALWHACGLTRPWNDPEADFRLACGGATSVILVEEEAGRMRGTVMVGFDGHRGWIYYLAVAPAARGCGVGRALMVAAETWLQVRDAPKLQLMVRGDNAAAHGFYAALGFEEQAVTVFGKRLS